jgi:hypothetical protein
MIITIGDQQMITGTAILAAAIHSLNRKAITVYHFNIVTDMGWLSSNIHLLCLCVMRWFLESKSNNILSYSKSHSVFPRSFRLSSMVVLAALLLYCSSVTGYELWDEKLSCPALCVMKGRRAGHPFRQMVVTYVFIFQSYVTQIVRVTPTVMNFCRSRIQPWIEKNDVLLSNVVQNRTLMKRPFWFLRNVGLFAWYFFTSDLEFMLEMMAWYSLGLFWIYTDRAAGHKKMEQTEISRENHVGFGQLVPLLLLMLIALACMEGFICKPAF